MNVSKNRQSRITGAVIGLLAVLSVFFLPQQAFAQNYVNEDQAVQILKAEQSALEQAGFQAYNNGQHELVYDLGYQYRYVQDMLVALSQGIPVATAVEESLPTLPFIIGNIETGRTMTESGLTNRVNELRNYANSLLVQ